jgi:hypothetical protein
MHISPASLASCCVLLCAAPGLADISFHAASQSLQDPTSYTPSMGSLQNYGSRSGLVAFVGELCSASVVVPADRIIVFTSNECDVGKILWFLRTANVQAAVELFGSDQDCACPNDAPPRYAYDPNSGYALAMNRIHGPAASQTLKFLLANPDNVTATMTFAESPWGAMYMQWYWHLYEAIVLAFFCVFVPLHGVACLVMIQSQRQKNVRPARMDLQTSMIVLSLCLGLVRILSETFAIARDSFGLWPPELFMQLMWGYSYLILLATMLLLIMFWSDLLASSKAKVTMIEKPNVILFAFILALGLGGITAVLFVVVYRYQYWPQIKAAGFATLGAVAFAEALVAIAYGSRIIRQLRSTAPIANRRKSSMGSSNNKQVASSPSLSLALSPTSGQASSNPMFDASPAAAPRRASILSLASSGSQKLDDQETRAQKQALKRAAPMTRLVVVSAFCLLCVTGVSIGASLTPALSVPITNYAVFMIVMFFEISIYGLVLYTVSPIFQERRRRRRRSSGGLVPVSEDEVEREKRCWARCWRNVRVCSWLQDL